MNFTDSVMRAAIIRGFGETNKLLQRIVDQNDIIIDQLKRLDEPMIELTHQPVVEMQPLSNDMGTLD